MSPGPLLNQEVSQFTLWCSLLLYRVQSRSCSLAKPSFFRRLGGISICHVWLTVNWNKAYKWTNICFDMFWPNYWGTWLWGTCGIKHKMKTNLGTPWGICLVICLEIKICAITAKGHFMGTCECMWALGHFRAWALWHPAMYQKVWKFEALFKVLFILYKQIYTCLLFIFSHPKCFNSSAPPKVSQPKVSQPKVSQPKVSQPTVSPFFPEPGHGVSTKSQSELCSIKNIGLTSKPHRADTCIPKKQNIVLWTQNVFHRKEEYKTS